MRNWGANAAAGILAGVLFASLSHAQQSPRNATRHAPPAEPGPQPSLRIDVDPLGYTVPSAFYLTYRLSSASLGFFDDDHLLFTFRVGGLLRRLPSDRDGDDDQEIRAILLDARSGKVIRQTEWRMHDRAQYLWPFPDGTFLVRVRDSLFLTDTSLALQPYLTFDTTLEQLDVSPDRKTLIVERDDPTKPISHATDYEGTDRRPVKVEMVRAGTRNAIAIRDAEEAVRVPMLGDGIADVLEGRQQGSWAVRDVPFTGEPNILAEVKSNCQPTVQPVSASVLLVLGCYQPDADRPVFAISAAGGELWQERWETRYVWGWFTSAENGSRFAYESVQVDRPISVFDALDSEDITQQLVGVYDTESGGLVLVKDATPVLTAGQNVALSPDGKRFAVLRHGAIEIYDLPPVMAPPPPRGPAQETAAKGARP
jgi:hypothetical protein